MPYTSTMDGDDDTVSDSVAVVVIVEPINKSNNVAATSMTQQPNTTIQKRNHDSHGRTMERTQNLSKHTLFMKQTTRMRYSSIT